jgi:tRNA A-37 threonylcarbamoyl transferase component Bud32
MATAERCPTPDELRARLAGPLADAERPALADHLEACARCRDAAEAVLSEGDGAASGARAAAAAELSHPRVAEFVRGLRTAGPPRTDVNPADAEATLAAPPPAEAVTMPAPPTLAPATAAAGPSRLAHYRVVKELGAGGMGVVYLAEDAKLERRVALKVMRPDLAAVPLHQQRFLREARAAAKIQCDHIVTIYHVDEENGVPFLAMQLLAGESMESWLQRGQRATPGQAARLAREAALGLAAAHAVGLVHRDIKPANLWLEAPKGRVKILDFGLARTNTGDQNLTSSGAIVGTPAYMAPEQARGETVDARTDLFSLGVVLFRLCTGRMPFRGGDPMSCMIAIAIDPPLAARDVNPDVPPALAELIAELLEKEPARRPPSAAAVADRLAAVEAGIRRDRTAAAAPEGNSLAVTPARPRRRRRGRAGVALAVLATLAAVGGWVWTDAGTLEVRTEDEGLQVRVVRKGQVVAVVDAPTAAPVRLRSGDYTLEPWLRPGAPGGGTELTTDQGSNEVRVRRGGTVAVTVRRADAGRPADAGLPEVAATPPEPARTEPAVPDVPCRVAPSPGPLSDLRHVAFSADGRALLAGYRARVWSYDPGDLHKADAFARRRLDRDGKGGIAHMAVAPDGRTFALRSAAAGEVVLWDVEARRERVSLPVAGRCNALEFSSDGALLAVGEDRSVRLWEGQNPQEVRPLTGHPAVVTALAFGPAGRKLAVGCKDGTLWLWDLATRQHEDISPLPRGSEVDALAFGHAGRLAVGRPHDTKLLHVGPARELFTFRSQGGAVALSPDGLWVAMSEGKRLALFDTAARRRYNLPAEHADAITHIAFAPDGRSVATGGKDGSVRVWDLAALLASAAHAAKK